MSVPVQGSRSSRLVNLTNTLTSSATFRKLVGASDAPSAAAHVYIDLALDDSSEPFPRAVIRHQGPQNADVHGSDSFFGKGQMTIYVQYAQPADADLESWYSIGSPITAADRRRHMNNLFGLISDEIMLVNRTAGCLEFQRLEEFSCGEIDPVTENGAELVEMCWVVHREGLP